MSESANGDPAPADRGQPVGWRGPPGKTARLKYLARYAYWRLGGYRGLRRVEWSSVRRLVFVCTGNICRSPYAEHVARALSLEAASFGIEAGENGAADPTALRVARQRGALLDGHRTTKMANFEAREGDLFVAMEPFQVAVVAKRRWGVPHQITLLGLWAGSNGAVIPDPYGCDDEEFTHSFGVIERGIEKIESRLSEAAERPPQRGRSPQSPS